MAILFQERHHPRPLLFALSRRVNHLAKEVPSNSENLGSKENLKTALGPSTLARNPGMYDQGYETVPSSTVC